MIAHCEYRSIAPNLHIILLQPPNVVVLLNPSLRTEVVCVSSC
jgi:hypothetical protein